MMTKCEFIFILSLFLRLRGLLHCSPCHSLDYCPITRAPARRCRGAYYRCFLTKNSFFQLQNFVPKTSQHDARLVEDVCGIFRFLEVLLYLAGFIKKSEKFSFYYMFGRHLEFSPPVLKTTEKVWNTSSLAQKGHNVTIFCQNDHIMLKFQKITSEGHQCTV